MPRSREPDRITSTPPIVTNASKKADSERDLPRIVVNAFVYDDAQTGSYTRAQLRLTEHGNPFRTALKGGNISAFQDATEDCLYPVGCIKVGGEDIEMEGRERISDALSVLAEQVRRLPREVAERVEAVPTGSSIILRLPLSDDRQVIVHYDSRDQSLTPRSVHLTVSTAPEPVDITAIVLACKCAFLLDVVYECADGIQLTPCEVRPGQQMLEMRLPVTQAPEIAEPKALSPRGETPWGVERRHLDVG
jgi:hypothetical protein